jgi:hypothetical protein
MSNTNPAKSRHCVDAAIDFANGKEHEGHGYSLRVTLRSGEVLEGTYTPLENLHPDVVFLLEETGLGRSAEVFLDKADIVKAVVVW